MKLMLLMFLALSLTGCGVVRTMQKPDPAPSRIPPGAQLEDVPGTNGTVQRIVYIIPPCQNETLWAPK